MALRREGRCPRVLDPLGELLLLLGGELVHVEQRDERGIGGEAVGRAAGEAGRRLGVQQLEREVVAIDEQRDRGVERGVARPRESTRRRTR